MDLSTENIQISFSPNGEISSLLLKEVELIWQGKEDFWSGKAPILFPICGFLKDGFYEFEGYQYQMPVHGFASSMKFQKKVLDNKSIAFHLESSDETRGQYPFEFKFSLVYTIEKNKLHISFKVENTDDKVLPFSLGWHPGFNIPSDSKIVFSEPPMLQKTVSKEGLIGKEIPFSHSQNIFELKDNTFINGGIVLPNYHGKLKLVTNDYTIDFNFNEFRNLVLWGQTGAQFVCIEPWNGMGDKIDSDHDFLKKENLILLPPGEAEEFSLSLVFNN